MLPDQPKPNRWGAAPKQNKKDYDRLYDTTLGRLQSDIMRARFFHSGRSVDKPTYGERAGHGYWSYDTGILCIWDGDEWICLDTNTGGADCMFDYLVSECWEGDEGEEFTSLTGCTFKVYSTIQAAVTDATATNGDLIGKVIFICEGDYHETVLIPSSVNNAIDFWGAGRGSVRWGPTALSSGGNACQINGGHISDEQFTFRGIMFEGQSGSYSVLGTAANVHAMFYDCEFNQKVAFDCTHTEFHGCDLLKGFHINSGMSPDHLSFYGGKIHGPMTWAGSNVTTNINFYGVNFESTGTAITWTSNGNGIGINFIGGGAAASAQQFFTINASGGVCHPNFEGFNFGQPGGANGCVYVQQHGNGDGNIPRIRMVGCYFAASSTHPYVKCDQSAMLMMVGNFMEDNGGIDVSGIIAEKSVIGPNIPNDTNVQADATSALWTYIGNGTVSGASATTAMHPKIQTGAIPPVHASQEAQFYWDTNLNDLYVYDGSGWVLVAGASFSSGHDIQEESVTLATQRALLDFRGSLLQAVDDGVDATAVFGGYREYDAIVDSVQYNALATTVPVYTTLQAAITAGHVSILFRASTDIAVTINPGDAVEYILGDTLTSASFPANLIVSKNGVLISNLNNPGFAWTLGSVGATAQACRFDGGATVVLSGDGASLVACAFVGLSAATAISVQGIDNRVQACRFQLCTSATTLIDLVASMAVGTSIVGNVWIAYQETGFFLKNNSLTCLPSINGNVFDMNATYTPTGACSLNIGSNFTGNSITMGAWTTAGAVTKTIVHNAVRSVVSGNIFWQNTPGNTATIKYVTGGTSLSGSLVTGNFFAIAGGGSSSITLILCENTSGGMLFTNNQLFNNGSSSQQVTMLNATNLNYVFSGNLVTTSSATPALGRTIPVRNSAGTAAISTGSVIKSNAGGLVDIQAYRYA